MRRIRRSGALTLTGIALLGAPLGAQQTVHEVELPTGMAQEVVAFVNDPATLRFEGDALIPRGRTVEGPLALVGGILTVDGEVRGDVVVLNGDLILGDEGVVTGDVLVVGGSLTRGTSSRVGGLVTLYARGLPLGQEDGRLVLREDRRRDRPALYIGGSRLSIRAGTGYNRVEGLPILLGPVINTGGRYPLRFDALATFRTQSGLSLDDMGYWIRLEQALGGGPRFRLGAAAYSEVQAMEGRGVADLESSLATLLFHRDLRDYFQNEGWQAYLDMTALEAPVTARLTYRLEDHYEVAVGDPWTLLRRDSEWRPNPLVGRGTLSSLEAELEVDNRNNPENPSDGWYLNASIRRGLDGDLEIPSYRQSPTGPELAPTPVSTSSTLATLDLRRHARVDPVSDLRLRVLISGALDRKPLPPQWQSALGGEGSLPGYPRFSLDCGARSQPVLVTEGERDRTTYPFYGCDRTALFQAEYRGELSFDLDLSPDGESWDSWSWWPNVDLTVAWLVFLDAGRGWSFTPGGADTETLADVGAGFLLGKLGFYWAYPLNGEDRDVNFFVRLQYRF
ncbi:MAG: hypothetical protein JSU98_06185 [Gemmatimonadales bacterium]|jgi:hypothetical protein|nr:MAG: hypothetical protein JSU98_06185 [Gemmatimonadales bacterium]